MMGKTLLESLQAEHAEKYARADELSRKEGRSDAETTELTTLIDECRGVKSRIDKERNIEDGLRELRSHREAVGRPPFAGGLDARNGGGATASVVGLAQRDEERVVIDSTGAVLSDIGPHAFGEKQWDAIQSPDYARAFRRYMKQGEKFFRGSGMDVRALEEGLDGQGGVLVPIQQMTEIVQRKPTPTRVSGMCNIITVSRDQVEWPRVKATGSDTRYTSPFRVTWTGENPSSSTAMDVSTPSDTFGNITIPIHTAMLSCPLSRNLVDDAAFDIVAFVQREFSTVRDLLYDDMALNGTGTGQPRGILSLSGASDDGDTVVAQNIGNPATADALLDLVNSIEEQYDENQVVLMRKTSTYKAIRKLKDSANRYIFNQGDSTNGLNMRPQRMLDGYPIMFSGFMPAAGSANKIVLTGDFTGCTIAQRLALSVQVLRETRAKLNQIEILATLRFGIGVLKPWQFQIGVQS